MKAKRKTELDVDFTGGMGPLTKEEEDLYRGFTSTRLIDLNVNLNILNDC